jgi:N-acetylmuramoyl-L-alanine amidase
MRNRSAIRSAISLGLLFYGFAGLYAQESAPLLEWRDDIGDTTSRATVHLLAKTAWPARVSINGDSCKLYRTGIFFKSVALQPGSNRIEAVVEPSGGLPVRFSRAIYRAEAVTRAALPLWFDSTSVLPAESHLLLPGDRLRISFKGARGHAAWVDVKPAKIRVYLRRSDYADYSRYEADLPLSRLPQDKEQTLHFALKCTAAGQKKSILRWSGNATVMVQSAERLPQLKVSRAGALLNQNLGPIRLGPPVIAELPEGVLLQSSGRIGEAWRIRLDDRDEGFIDIADVAVVPEPAPTPGYYITSLSAAPAAGADIVAIPWLQAVPYALFPDPSGRALRVRLYGVKSSSTWITHRANLRVIDRLSWEQITPETYEITIHLQREKIWGYTIRPAGAALELRFKHPPAPPASPALGLKVAIEAGHGGSNLGAVGLSGLEEKCVNLDVARRLEQLCAAAGMTVLQVREDDSDMSLGVKKEKIEGSDADLLVCIHANAGGNENGYLGANGTSTYYNNPFWGDFARLMYGRLLELPLREFGCVGSFNYRIIRMSSRPAILVELAFLSHAEDEEKLFLPEFRQQLAGKILAGIEDFVASMQK